jgi:coenzyme F420 hydrogenase subunit beta
MKSSNTFYSSASIIEKTVIYNNNCIGCGICTVIKGSPFKIHLNSLGQYAAYIPEESNLEHSQVNIVCPFSEQALNEDEIGKALFAKYATYNPNIGFYLSTYVGYIYEGNFRELGSSGGVAKWILYTLRRTNKVDAVVQVIPNIEENSKLIYKYTISHSLEDILAGSKSAYYPVEMSKVLSYIRENPGKYAIVGIPCFIKAVRLLSMADSLFNERICFTVSLICGHLKSKNYAEMMGWQLGILPDQLAYIDFRKKIPGKKANQKGVEVKDRSSSVPTKLDIVQNLFGASYDNGFFQYNACNFCDDVVGETADISVGDAWLPKYLPDEKGTSVVIIRNQEISQLVETAIHEKRALFEPLPPNKIVKSQGGGFRQRKEGLAYRLYLMEKSGHWYPPKRVKPKSKHISTKRKEIYSMRMQMTTQSHLLFEQAKEMESFDFFKKGIEPLLKKYLRLRRQSTIRRTLRNFLHYTYQWTEKFKK